MITPLPSEAARLAALREYQILDTDREDEYNDIVRLAAFICGTPIAAISLIDARRQWFKSVLGVEAVENPIELSFCTHTIRDPDLTIIPDAQSDERFAANPMVTGEPHIRFYAGAPLITGEGHALGALCVIDRVPRVLTTEQEDALRMLARQTVAQMELRRQAAIQDKLLAERLPREEALRESEARFRISVDAMEEGLVLMGEAGGILFCNESAERILGLPASAMVGCTPTDPQCSIVRENGEAFPGEELPATMAMRHGISQRDAIMGIHKPNGELIWICVTAVPLMLAPPETSESASKIRGVVVTFTDITERRKADDAMLAIRVALQKSEARLLEAQRIAQIGNWEYDIKTSRIVWSKELFRLFEMDPRDGEPTVEALMSRYYPADVPVHEAQTSQAILDGQPYEFDARIVRRDGTLRWAHAVGRGERDATGQVVRLFGTLMDIDQRKTTEEALRDRAEKLRQSEAALRAVLESAPVILYAADAHGTIILLEGKGLAAIGLKPGEWTGQPIFKFRAGGAAMESNARRALRGESVSYDTRLDDLYVHNELRPVLNERGEPVGLIGVCFDITELKRAEEAVRDHAIVLEFQKGQLVRANEELEALAATDGLTGLRNHRALQERLLTEVSEAARYHTPLSLILMDVDRFKSYNDAYGHPAGDAVLREIARILFDCARDTDILGRYGGEEFVLILPQTDREGAEAFAERVRAAVESNDWYGQAVTGSFGVASLQVGDASGADLVARADEALYRAKAAGRNRIISATERLSTPRLAGTSA